MKKIMIAAAALAAIFTSTAAMAADSGPRVEATVGYNDVTNVPGNRGFSYGVSAGYDVKLIKNVTVGVEAGLDNVFDRSDVNVGGRIGYALNDHTVVFADGGYDNFRDLKAHTIEGARVGGGVQVNVAGPLYALVQYHYTDLGSTHKNAVSSGIGVRF